MTAEERAEAIKRQVEYYFSRQNLLQVFLRKELMLKSVCIISQPSIGILKYSKLMSFKANWSTDLLTDLHLSPSIVHSKSTEMQ